MPEITFIFGVLFGIACGLGLNRADKARMAWLEEQCAEYRTRMHYWRRIATGRHDR